MRIITLRNCIIVVCFLAVFMTKAEVFYEDLFCFNPVSSTEVELANAFSPPNHMDYIYDPNDPMNDVLGVNYWHNRKNVILPERITHDGKEYAVVGIGMNAFEACYLMESISLPPTIRYIRSDAFTLCTGLKSIDIPAAVSSIGDRAFSYCQELTDIVVPENCQGIGQRAFSNCLKLERVTIGKNVRSIGDYAFAGCSKIRQVIFADGSETLQLGIRSTDNKIINGMTKSIVGLFWDSSTVEYVYIGRDLSYITSDSDYRPFYMIGEAEIGPMVKHIPDNLFHGTLAKISGLPEGLETIGNSAFWGTTPKGDVFRLPSTLQSIGAAAFQDQLVFECAAVNPPTIEQGSTFGGAGYKKVFVPNGSGSLYRNSQQWRGLIIIDEDDETLSINVKTAGSLLSRLSAKGYDLSDVYSLKVTGNVDEDDLSNISSMNYLHFIDLSGCNMTSIPNEMFKNTGLTRIVFPSNLQSIGALAFYNGCFRGDLVIPETCTSIGVNAFANTLIESLTIESAECEIKGGAFSQCKRLKNLDLDGDNIIIGAYAFSSDDFASLTLGNGVSVGAESFGHCKIADLNLAEGFKSIGIGSFKYSEIEEVSFPASLENVGSQAFYGSTLQKAHFEDGCGTIGGQAFAKCDSLKEITLPNNLKILSDSLFYLCTNLQKVNIPSECTSIGNYVFCYTKIEDVSLPKSLTHIGIWAFGWGKLKTAHAPWRAPIEIAEDAFAGGGEKLLYVPIACATKYKKTPGWSVFTRFKESGTLNLNVEGHGMTVYDGSEIRSRKLTADLLPYEPLEIEFAPDSDCVIECLTINGENQIVRGENVGDLIVNNLLYIDEVENDFDIYVKFTLISELPVIKTEVMVYDGSASPMTIMGVDEAIQQSTSPNALYFVEKAVDVTGNFIINDTAETISILDEKPFYSPKNVSVTHLTYKRTFNNVNWQAFYVPFNISYDEWSDYVEIAEVSNVRGYDENNDGIIERTVLEFNRVRSGELSPNTPYVVKAKQTGPVTFECRDKTLYATPNEEGYVKCSSTRYWYIMKGIYQDKYDVFASGAYALSGGLFRLATNDAVVLKPFRFYLMIDPKVGGYNDSVRAKLPQLIEIEVDGEASILFEIESESLDSQIYYDLSGKCIPDPHNGMFITNGKVVLIK